ncbi:unnamed protein product [Discosporangium mesarthrocarpum]
MAGRAAKKAARASAKASSVYAGYLLLVNLVYVLFRAIYKFKTFTRWHAVGFIGTSAVEYVCYHGLVEAAGVGVGGGSVYFDVMAVFTIAQLVCMFTEKGWYIFLMVPGYYLSLFSYRVLGQLMRSQQYQDSPGGAEQSKREKKAARKKERQAARGVGVRFSR